LLLTRSRSEDEPVAGGVRSAVEAGGGDAGRDADSGRAVARRELGERNSSRLATPAATPMNLFIGTSLVGRQPRDLSDGERAGKSGRMRSCAQTGRVEALHLILTPCWTRRRLRRLPTRQVLAEHSRRSRAGAIAGGLSRVRPFPSVPRRAPSSGLQRSPAVNSGHRLRPLTCVSAEQRAARQYFPSSRSGGHRHLSRRRLVPGRGYGAGAKTQSCSGQSTPLNGKGNGFAAKAASKLGYHGQAKPKSTQ
jgi:hypothetical protein